MPSKHCHSGWHSWTSKHTCSRGGGGEPEVTGCASAGGVGEEKGPSKVSWQQTVNHQNQQCSCSLPDTLPHLLHGLTWQQHTHHALGLRGGGGELSRHLFSLRPSHTPSGGQQPKITWAIALECYESDFPLVTCHSSGTGCYRERCLSREADCTDYSSAGACVCVGGGGLDINLLVLGGASHTAVCCSWCVCVCCFHRSSGYHVRVFTQYQMDRMPDGPNPRGIWGSLDKNTVVVIVSVCWARGGGGGGANQKNT